MTGPGVSFRPAPGTGRRRRFPGPRKGSVLGDGDAAWAEGNGGIGTSAFPVRGTSVNLIADDAGTVRVRLVLPTWDDYLAVAVDEIRALLPGLLPSVSERLT